MLVQARHSLHARMSEKLSHLIYASTAAPGFEIAELPALLLLSRANNERLGVTGMLLHTSGSFFQILEGNAETLGELFAVISRDPRHTAVAKIIDEPIAQRAFGDWKMAFAEASPQEVDSIEGFSDFFASRKSYLDLQPGRAKKLLAAFAEGRWRRGPRVAAA
jgi:hypothetical protein